MIVHTTDRLTLRRVTLDDAPFVYELVTDPDWLRFIGDRGVKTVVDAAAYLARAYLPHYERHGFGLYVVEPRENGGPLGLCGLLKRDTLEHPDIGFAFLPTRAARATPLRRRAWYSRTPTTCWAFGGSSRSRTPRTPAHVVC